MTARAEIERQLASPDPETRRRGAARLASESVDDPVPLLMLALGDDDWRVRKEATAAAVASTAPSDIVRALVTALEPGDNVGLRNAAVEALAGLGAPAVEALTQNVAALDADGRKLAAEALAQSGQSAALEPLKTLLEDPDPNVRIAAVEAIAVIGSACVEDAVPLLECCLGSDDRLVRLAALDGLNRMDVPVPWELVERLLTDPFLARPALLAAGRSAHPHAAPRLAQCLQHANRTVWLAAISAMADLIRTGEAALLASRSALSTLDLAAQQAVIAQTTASDNIDIRRDALVVVGALGGSDAAAAAVDALTDDRVAAEAEEALAILGADAVPTLVYRATAEAADVRAMSIELLGRVADESAVATGAIVHALGDESDEVVRAALAAVARVGDESCLHSVAQRVSTKSTVRKFAEAALATLAQRYPSAARQLALGGATGHVAAVLIAALGSPVHESVELDVEFLSNVLSTDDAAARRAAVDALAGIATTRAVEAVAFAITDEEQEVRLAGVRALGRMRGDDGSVAGFDHLLDLVERSQDEPLVTAAIRALGDTGDPRAADVLKRIGRTGGAMAAVAAVEAMGELPAPRRFEALIDALSHRESEVVKAALRVLAVEDEPRVLTHLGACLDHAAWDVRRLAADLLANNGDANAVALLRAKLSSEDEPLVKEALMRALSELESASGLRRSTTPPPRRGSWPPR
jgi:HEAT repeat protein